MASVIAEGRPGTSARGRFVTTIFLGSFLLFLVQPMIARMVMPRLGGAPAVWNSAMLNIRRCSSPAMPMPTGSAGSRRGGRR